MSSFYCRASDITILLACIALVPLVGVGGVVSFFAGALMLIPVPPIGERDNTLLPSILFLVAALGIYLVGNLLLIGRRQVAHSLQLR